MKKLLLSVAALVLATLLLSLDDSNSEENAVTQEATAKVEKSLEVES